MDLADLEGRQWCEYAVPNFLPSLRAKIVVALTRTYGMSQRQMAERLGISQAAVSHYTTFRRGNRRSLAEHDRLSKYSEKLADRIARGLSGPRLTAAICGICTSFRQGESTNPCLCLHSGVSKPEFLESLPDDSGFTRQPCETFVVRRLLPALRSEAARVLSEGRGQYEVGSLLGVSQPAVSQYMANKRGDEPFLRVVPGLDREVSDLSQRLDSGLSPPERREAICSICVESRKVGSVVAQTA